MIDFHGFRIFHSFIHLFSYLIYCFTFPVGTAALRTLCQEHGVCFE